MEYSLPKVIYEFGQWVKTHDFKPHRGERDRSTLLDAWKSKLFIDDDDLTVRFCFLFSHANKRVLSLLESKQDIEHDSKKAFLKALSTTGSFTEVRNLNNHWTEFRQRRIYPEYVSDLRGMRDILSSDYSLEILEEDKMQMLLEEIVSITEEISDTVQDVLLRDYLTAELNFLKLCIEKFELLGGYGLGECIGKIIQKTVVLNEKLASSTSSRLMMVASTMLILLVSYEDMRSGIDRAVSDAEILKKGIQAIYQASPLVRLIEDKSEK